MAKKIKLKTHRGAAKRFKRTKTGKFLRSKAFKQHILSSKSTKRKRNLRGTTTVADVWRATQQSVACPSCNAPMVGTKPTLPW